MTDLALKEDGDLAEVAEFLQGIYRKENAAAYQQNDYLGLGKPTGKHRQVGRQHGSGACSPSVVRSSRITQKIQPLGAWEMSAQGRWQIGQWFYRSKSS